MQHTLKGYRILEKLYDGPQTLVYRGQREVDQQNVIVKFIKTPYPTLLELKQFRHQYSILQNLDLPGVLKVYGLEQSQNRLALIFEDCGGISLSTFVETQTFENIQHSYRSIDQANAQKFLSLSTFFSIALQLAQVLEGLYQNKLVHKDIKPENILVNPKTLEVKLIDFSIASYLKTENQGVQNPNLLQGTLAYISPEQTGRMNRGIDYRTDFYSLGVTFYKILTGQLPFESVSPLQLIHDHIASTPRSPHQLNPGLPLALNQIILKLMAKMPEDRYQTAYGLQADLLYCQSLWVEGKSLTSFELGTEDISDHFSISEKLYGREHEVKTLISVFDRVAQGGTEIIFVTGPSGIGKTTVVQEIHKPIAKHGGYFIYGKFSQLQNNSPLSGLVQAFRNLIQQLLTESKQNLEVWQTKILEALGGNGQILIEVLPELEILIGEQPSVPELDAIAAQNRFNFLFQRFIQVFPQLTRPLVVFLDDLQWADFASLQVIQSIIAQTTTPYLLIIGSYRSEEVFSAHPLQLTIDRIKKTGVVANTLILKSLKFHDLTHLITDTLNCSYASAEPLSRSIYETSQGNPFFCIQLIKSFYQEGLIKFNYIKRSWQWDLFEIQELSPTHNVIEFVSLQVQKLSPITQDILHVAACKGGSFSVNLLAHILKISLIDLEVSVWEALQAGLIICDNTVYKTSHKVISKLEIESVLSKKLDLTPSQLTSDEDTYSFIHDRVQQAAYGLIPKNRQKAIHFEIGFYILNALSPIQKEDEIFEIVNQINLGIDNIKTDLERKKIARLNWIAGCKAKTSIAYTDAARYYAYGIDLLGFNSWDLEYELTLDLHYGAAEAALLMGVYERVNILTQEIEKQAKHVVDQVKAHQVRIEAYKAQGQVVSAITEGLSALNLLGIPLTAQPLPQDFQTQFCEIQLALANKSIEDLADLSIMTAREQLITMELLGRLLPITYSYNPFLFSILILKLVELSLSKGNSPNSSWAYISYGVVLWTALGDIDTIYQFGELGVKLGYKFGIKEHLVKVNLTFNIFIKHWKNHLRETLAPLLENYVMSLKVGDFVQASFSIVDYIEHSLWCGQPLILLEQENSQYYESVVNLNQEITLKLYEICWQATLNLMKDNLNPEELRGKIIDESIILSCIESNENRQAIFLLYLYKLYLCYLFRNYSKALQNSELGEPYLDSVPCRIVVVIFSFYRLLSLLATYAEKSSSEQNILLETIMQQSDQLKKWAESAPMNFLHKYYLVKAEQYRILEQHIEAMSAYDLAITLAQENEYLNEEALAYELAGVFYLNWGKTTIAQAYLINAYYSYERWGAKAKLKDLEEHYPDLLNLFQKAELNRRINTITTFSEDTSLSSNTVTLDWASVMRTSQALSQEIDLDRLLTTIMQVVIENAGAEHGSLLLMEEEKLTLNAYCNLEGCYTNQFHLINDKVQWHQNLPMSVLNYVERTQLALVLANAVNDNRFAMDPYMEQHQPRSILCMPIQRQGQLVGLLYLENNLTTDAFTTDRLEVLQLLTAQAAISLENAQLYASVEQKVKDRTIELQIAKQEAELAKEASEKANLAKSEFLASMSHELRTPLNAVLGFSQLLHRDPSASPEQKQKLGIINRSGEHLLTLINDVLTMSKIEAGRTTLNEKDFDIQAMLRSLHEMLLLKANLKNLKFKIECAPEVPQFIQTDEGKLRQVLVNLLGNAIKFTQHGYVKLRVNSHFPEKDSTEQDSSDRTVIFLNFEVEDTGPGIASHELKDLFETFAQTETGRQSQEGTGLGLPISQKFIQLMGGDIKVSSTVGEGTCFTFNIECFSSEEMPLVSPSLGNVIRVEPSQLIYRILVVEDRVENQEVLVDLLESVGFEVQVASNGKEAIATWQTYLPHLILMDLQMPIMDGYEAFLAIKSQSVKSQQPLPIVIAVTANTFEDTRLKTVEMGFNDFVHKPFQVETLLETLAQHSGIRYLREGASSSIEPQVQNEPKHYPKTLSSEDFQILAYESRLQIHLAASSLDEAKLLELIELISEEHPALASILMSFLKKFRFDQIVALFEPTLNN
jgi:predicted ATPase/signal transduction histidine kinase/DNA-binding response OmpR family regulator